MISPKNCLLDRHDPSQQFFVFSCDLSFAICGIDHEVLDDHGFDEQVLELDVYGFDDGNLDVLFLVFGSMPIAVPHF